jgi:hypothetical protein
LRSSLRRAATCSRWNSRERDRHASTATTHALTSAQSAVKSAQAQLETIEARRAQAVEQFEKKVEALIGMANDPTVLVRNYGVNLVYHSARRPCGKANPNYSVEMPWG